MNMASNLLRIVVYNSIWSVMLLLSSYLPNMGLAAANIEHLAFKRVVIPALAIEIVYYSIASCMTTLSSGLILSNSSIQQTPPLASTSAPASKLNYPLWPVRVMEAVRPAALLPFPLVYTATSLTRSMNLSN
jgi:hypothetical protein